VNSPSPEVTIESREGIAWITFNVPQKANALTAAMLQKVEQTLAEGATNNAVRAVVITGAGARAFSAGADLTLAQCGCLTRTASFADPGAESWTATVDYGDGAMVRDPQTGKYRRAGSSS